MPSPPGPMIDVLLDMTPLDTGSRFRGIGRYVTGLAQGIRGLGPNAPSGLRIAGLTSNGSPFGCAVDETLSYGGQKSKMGSWWTQKIHRARRRTWVGTFAARTQARLLHVTEPVGTPLDSRTPRVMTCFDIIPLVLHREYLSPYPGTRAFWAARERWRFRHARRVIAISEATKRDLVEHLGMSPDRIDVTHLGVDHSLFRSEAEADDASRVRALGVESPYLLYVGAGDPRKDLPLFLRAFGASGRTRDVSLVLAGKLEPEQEAELRSIAGELGIDGRMRILGYVPDELVPALYRQCVAHVFPSRYEGFGLPVAEALACGAPTITTLSSSLTEVAGDAAITVPVSDQAALSEAIRRLVDDEQLRRTLRERGLRVAARFTWDACARATVASYLSALA